MSSADNAMRTLRRDIEEVLALQRCGGSVIQRDSETLIISGCAQVTGEQLLLLQRMHPATHLWIDSAPSPSQPGLTVYASTLPQTALLFTSECLQVALAAAFLGAVWLS